MHPTHAPGTPELPGSAPITIDTVLRTVADRLDSDWPTHTMNHGTLLTFIARAVPENLPAAFCEEVRRHAPDIQPGDTRSGYAARIRAQLAGVNCR